MLMASAAAAWAAAGTRSTAAAATGGRLGRLAAGAGGEDGQLFGQFFGTAFGAGRAFPTAGANQQFAVHPALLTMKLVNRHGGNIGRRRNFSNGATLFMKKGEASSPRPSPPQVCGGEGEESQRSTGAGAFVSKMSEDGSLPSAKWRGGLGRGGAFLWLPSRFSGLCGSLLSPALPSTSVWRGGRGSAWRFRSARSLISRGIRY